jgi:glycolate oxidase iron-sulfur subunit
VLRDEPLERLGIHGDRRLAFHCPALCNMHKSSVALLKVCLSDWASA